MKTFALSPAAHAATAGLRGTGLCKVADARGSAHRDWTQPKGIVHIPLAEASPINKNADEKRCARPWVSAQLYGINILVFR